MKGYGQYCPIARGAEIFAERWTPIIVRNMLLGSDTFSDILRGAPGLSKTLLTQRLRQLERVGVVSRLSSSRGRGARYALTDAGRELWDVCFALGKWGARWVEVAPEHLDPGLALWSACKSLQPDRIPKDPLVIRFEFTDRPRKQRVVWLLIEHGRGEVCVKHPSFDEDVWVRTDSQSFVLWSLGRISWSDALRTRRISADGPPRLIQSFPSWFAPSAFGDVAPATARQVRVRANSGTNPPRRAAERSVPGWS